MKNTIKQNGFRILLCENDQPEHLVWMAEYTGVSTPELDHV